jgi:hypothetical protein
VARDEQQELLALLDMGHLHFSYSDLSIAMRTSDDELVSIDASSRHFAESQTNAGPDLSSSLASTDSVDSFFKYCNTSSGNPLGTLFSTLDKSIYVFPERSMLSSSSGLHSLQEIPSTDSSPPAVPFIDLNMFTLACSHEEPPVGINPSDTLWNAEMFNQLVLPSSECSPSTAYSPMPSPGGLESPNLSRLSDGTTYESMSVTAPLVEQDDITLLLDPPLETPELHPETFHSPGILKAHPPPQADVKSPLPVGKRAYVHRKHANVEERSDCGPEEELCQTPVLNAHLGIDVADLESRAEKFRKRNPGKDLSREWLESYAGKLSARGQLIEAYRCYVVGCTQKNKRRDHILIHVGSHLDQRPFKCAHWYGLNHWT